MERFELLSKTFNEEVLLKGSKFVPETIKAIVVVCHGMAEHCARYYEFAQYLENNGFITYLYDQRGHGETCGDENNQGYMSDVDNFEAMVDDLDLVLNMAKNENPDKKVFLLGHSMGSFIAQRFIEKYPDDANGVILSGTNYTKGLLFKAGYMIAKRIVKKNGRQFKSDTLENLSFGSYNKAFKPNRTPFDWLSVNEDNVDRYIADPFCGAKFSCSYYMDLLKAFNTISKNYQLIKKDLPLYLFSGEDDPVGNKGKGVKKLFNTYKKLGLNDVDIKLYTGYRHEMLNELNKLEVFKDVLNWLIIHNN